MPAKNRKVPAYRLHKPTGQAVVRLDGRDYYLGKHGTEASQEAYRRKIAEWLTAGSATGTAGPKSPPAGLPTVNDVMLAFLTRHADSYYRHADGTPTGEAENFKHALRPVKKLYGRTPATDFGPLALKAVRKEMVDSGLSRTTINARVGKIVRVFKWATENELVPASIHHALTAVSGLRKGRSAARESKPVKSVPDASVDAIRPHVSPQVWAMVELQRLTGMRPGEVTIMRTGDLDMTSKLWGYIPNKHKTEHQGKERRIPLGPKAQAVLRPWLRTDLTAYLFSPKEAVEALHARRSKARNTKTTPSEAARRCKGKPGQGRCQRYDKRTYRQAIVRACRKAGVPEWSPNQLRHNAATRLRKEFGLDVARAVLGHCDADTTTIYAERDATLAADAMERVG